MGAERFRRTLKRGAGSVPSMRVPRHEHMLRSATLLSLMLHGLVLYTYPDREPPPEPLPPDPVMALTLLAEPTPGGPEGSAEASVAPMSTEISKPDPRPPSRKRAPTPPKPPEVPPAPADPAVAEPQPRATSQGAPPPAPSFRSWQAQRTRGLPGFGSRTPTPRGLGGQGRDRARSRGTKRCTPHVDRIPEVVYLLIDSSGSMDSGWGALAVSCAQQYARAAMAGGALVGVGNFAERATFTRPTRDMVDVNVALRTNNNGQGTQLPARQLGPLFQAHEHLRGDLVLLSDGYLPNYRDAMPWYLYFLDMNAQNRGYLYSIGSAAPQQVTAAFENSGFQVFTYLPI